MLIVIKKINRD